MARLARVVAVDVPHHVMQRANARQFILSSDAEKMVYMDLLRSGRTTARVIASGLLFDVQSRSFGGDSPQARRSGICVQAEPWSVCVLLERFSSFQRTRLARPLLFVSIGYSAPVGSAALSGTEPGSGLNGQ